MVFRYYLQHFRSRLLSFLLIFVSVFLLSNPSLGKTIKVGIYSNKPLAFQDEQGTFQGLTVDVLRYIAKQEEWQLQFVQGSWSECLQRLKAGEIDLQVAIAVSEERKKIFDYPEQTLITNWGRLYRHPDTLVSSLLELDGKTVALLENDIHAKVFLDLMDKFNKVVIKIPVDNYDAVLEQVASGKVDVGVVNRMYAMQNAHHFQVKATPMIFNPIAVRYAVSKGQNGELLQAIDRHLKELRGDKSSIYYRSLEKWFAGNHATTVPQWIMPTLLAGGGLLLVILLVSLLLKRQVAAKTRELQTTFDSSPAAIFIHDMEGNIININKTMQVMYGVKKVEGLRLSITDDYSAPENPFEMLSAHWQKVATGEAQQFEWIARRPHDGTTFEVQVNLEKILFGNRDVIYATVQDISEKKEAERKLAAQQEWLTVTLRSIGDGVIATDTDGKIVFINRIAEEITGWSSKKAQGKPAPTVFNIINEKTGQKCVSPVQRVLETGRIIGLANHTAIIAKDGSISSIADSGAPIRNLASEIVGVVIVFRDVSHERKMEEELLKIKKLESIGVLAGGIAHDFNNILAAILGNIELVSYRIDQEDSKTASLLHDAKKATRRATKLTQQLLTFAKGGEPVRGVIALPELIAESADFVLHGSQVSCTYSAPDDLWDVDVDSGQIGQVIQNIIINAQHAMPEGGSIAIKCSNIHDAAIETRLSIDNGEYVRVTIKDTGVGVSKEIIDKIFDPYFSTKQRGSGLGLAICHSIMNKHEGFITVDSLPGQGTTFTLYLPAVPTTGTATTSKTNNTSATKACRIMVMDDDKMIRDVAQAQLENLGHESIMASDGRQAIDKYQELQDNNTPVDIIIMDLTIPGGIGGREAAEKLLVIDPEAKLIVASGYSNDPVMADYQKYGFCAAIAKPFDLKELNEAIASVLHVKV